QRDDSGVLPDDAAGIGLAQVLDALFAKLEARGAGLAGGEGAQHGERERRGAEAAGVAHWMFSGMFLLVVVIRGRCRAPVPLVSEAPTGVLANGNTPPTYDAVLNIAQFNPQLTNRPRAG